jgi:diguanylate cyclase (GGDEF)-like protein
MRSSAVERARAAALLYAVGAAIGALVLLVPGWDTLDRPRLWAAVLGSLLTAMGLWRAGGLSMAATHAVLALSTCVISVLLVLGGGGAATGANGIFFTWAAVYAFAMLPRRAAVAHLGLMAVGLVSALVVLGEGRQAPAQATLTIGGSAAVGVVVGELVERVRRLAGSDPLTGLANRRTAQESLARAEAEARRRGHPLSVAALDLDDFKRLNDTQGHAGGDRALQACARAWSGELRTGDLLARVGGDEFLVILADCPLAAAVGIAERIAAATPGALRCSVGVALWDGRESIDALLLRADEALYRAKRDRAGLVAAQPAGRSR